MYNNRKVSIIVKQKEEEGVPRERNLIKENASHCITSTRVIYSRLTTHRNPQY